MTCVWDAILRRMTADEKALLRGPASANTLLNWVQQQRITTPSVRVNGVALKPQELKENAERITSISNIHNGYDMSSSDPLMCLLCQRLGWDITVNFYGTHVRYTNAQQTSTPRSVAFNASNGHFS